MCGSSKPDTLLNSARSISVMSSPELGEALFQFSTTSPQTNKTLTTVATIRTRRDRKAASNLFALAGCGVFFSRDVLASDRDLDVDPVGFAGKGLLVGVVSESDEFVTSGAAAGSIATKVIGSVAPASFGCAATEIEDNTAAEHHSDSISNFGDDSDTASSRKTRMSPREIGRGLGKL